MEDMIPQGSPAPHDGPGYETTEVSLKGLLIFAVALTLTTVVTMAILAGWYGVLAARERAYRQDRPPRYAYDDPSQFPPPVIQPSPLADMLVHDREEAEKLATYGWVDQSAGIARIPIARAMELTLEQLRESSPAREGSAPAAGTTPDTAPDAAGEEEPPAEGPEDPAEGAATPAAEPSAGDDTAR